MKIPCELIVWYVLPSITQAEVARRFGVTDAAISQYLKSKRGTNKELENSGRYEEFKAEVGRAAQRIIDGSDIVTETCRVCDMVKRSGMLVKVYETHTGVKAPACVCPDCTHF